MAIGRILSRLRPSFMASAATRAHLPPGERGAVRRLLSRLQAQGMAAAAARGQGARACAAARGQKARACAAARLEAIRAEGGAPRAILEFAEARAQATHAYVISSQQQARPAAFMAALRLRQATDMAIMIVLRLVFGIHASAFKEVLNTLAPPERTFIIMLCVNKIMNDLHNMYPQLIPTLEAVNRLVSTAPETVCPFLGIQSLPFEVCPVEGGLIAVLELVGTSAGIILMFAGGLCVSLCLDIMELLLPNPKLVEYGTKNAESHRADVAAGDVDKDSKIGKAELCVFDVDLVNVDQATLFDLILAANYLDIKDLLDLNCQMVARIIKCKTPEQIRKTFNIKNDFTAEPAAEWAFE